MCASSIEEPWYDMVCYYGFSFECNATLCSCLFEIYNDWRYVLEPLPSVLSWLILHVSSRCRGTDRFDSGCHLVIIYSAIYLFSMLLLQEIFVDWGWCSGTSPLSPGLLLQINVCTILSLCLPPYSGCHFLYYLWCIWYSFMCFGSWYLYIIYSTAGWHSGTSPLSHCHIAAVSAICFRLPYTIPDVQLYLFLSSCSLPFVVFNL